MLTWISNEIAQIKNIFLFKHINVPFFLLKDCSDMWWFSHDSDLLALYHTVRLPERIVLCIKLMNINIYNLSSSSSSASSSRRAIITYIPDPLSPPFSIVHCFRLVFMAKSRIGTELLYVGSNWSSCLCSSMWRGSQVYITYVFVLTSPAVSCMSILTNPCVRTGYDTRSIFKRSWTGLNSEYSFS